MFTRSEGFPVYPEWVDGAGGNEGSNVRSGVVAGSREPAANIRPSITSQLLRVKSEMGGINHSSRKTGSREDAKKRRGRRDDLRAAGIALRVVSVSREKSRAENHATVILSERVGVGVGAKDLRTNPDADPRAARRSFAPYRTPHPS